MPAVPRRNRRCAARRSGRISSILPARPAAHTVSGVRSTTAASRCASRGAIAGTIIIIITAIVTIGGSATRGSLYLPRNTRERPGATGLSFFCFRGAMRARLHALAIAALAVAAAGGIEPLSLPESRAQSSPKAFDLAIANGRVSVKGDTIRVKKGDHVELRWSSDRPIVLHLHGYDIVRRVAPDSGVAMEFKAHLTGRFPVSEHKDHGRHERPILYLEVHP